MPLDIQTAPATTPGGAATGASNSPAAAPSGLAISGGALAVFSLLLAQVAQPPSVGAQAGAVKSTARPDTGAIPAPTGAKSPTTPRTEKSKDDGKDKKTVTGALSTPTVPVPPLPPPVTPTVIAPTPAATGSSDKTTPGKVMDTAPLVSGELLSQTQQTTAQTQSVTTDIIVPAEADGPPTPTPAADAAAKITSLVPAIAAQASQAIVLPATPAAPGKSGSTSARPSTPAALYPPTPATAPVAATQGPVAATQGPVAATQGPVAATQGPVAVPPSLQNNGLPADDQTGSTTGTPAPPVLDLTPRKLSSEKPAAPAANSASAAVTTSQTDPAAMTGAAVSAPPVTGQAAGAAAMPAPDRTRMVAQVADSVQTMATQAGGSGQRQMTLQIHPKDWGQVNVSVTMTPTTGADGKVTTQVVATVVAQNPEVKAALETHQEDLRQALQGTGLHLDTLTVTVQASAGGGAQAGPGNDRQPGTSGGWAGAQSQAAATGGGGSAPFNSNGGQPSAFADFGQGDSAGRRPPSPYATTPTGGGEDLAAASTTPAIGNSIGRIDTLA